MKFKVFTSQFHPVFIKFQVFQVQYNIEKTLCATDISWYVSVKGMLTSDGMSGALLFVTFITLWFISIPSSLADFDSSEKMHLFLGDAECYNIKYQNNMNLWLCYYVLVFEIRNTDANSLCLNIQM